MLFLICVVSWYTGQFKIKTEKLSYDIDLHENHVELINIILNKKAALILGSYTTEILRKLLYEKYSISTDLSEQKLFLSAQTFALRKFLPK